MLYNNRLSLALSLKLYKDEQQFVAFVILLCILLHVSKSSIADLFYITIVLSYYTVFAFFIV